MPHHHRYKQAKKVTLIGAIMNACLGVIKLITGHLFHSHSLIADGFHSFSDLLTDAMVIFASKYGSQSADTRHPYGHQRIETAATLFLAMLLILTGIGIAWDSIAEILAHKHQLPKNLALPVALLSIIVNEGLFHYTRHEGLKIHSDLLIANAWHHRSDAGASFIVFIGLVGSLFGLPYFDPLAAVVVGFLIIKMGIEYGWNSINELIDTSVDNDTLNNIISTIKNTNGVCKIHQLRTRMMGRDIFVDVHILVSPFLSVSEGHFIAQQVHYTLLKTIANIKDVTVHVDPEDDEQGSPALHLPNRKHLENTLLQPLIIEYPLIQDWQIHYLAGRIIIDLILNPEQTSASIENYTLFKQRLALNATNYPHPISIRLLNHVATIGILPTN